MQNFGFCTPFPVKVSMRNMCGQHSKKIMTHRNPNPLRDSLLADHQFRLGPDGALAVPLDRPGLGVTVDMAALERFTV